MTIIIFNGFVQWSYVIGAVSWIPLSLRKTTVYREKKSKNSGVPLKCDQKRPWSRIISQNVWQQRLFPEIKKQCPVRSEKGRWRQLTSIHFSFFRISYFFIHKTALSIFQSKVRTKHLYYIYTVYCNILAYFSRNIDIVFCVYFEFYLMFCLYFCFTYWIAHV